MPLEAGLTRQGGAEPSPQGGKGGGAPAPAKERCPRCDSRDTKFCYYNNYNTAQPRHFCKSCRRYWTLGGSLRNVPIGGASRKRLRRSTSDSAGGFRIGAASETPARVVSGLSTPPAASSLVAERPNSETTAPPRGSGPDHNWLLGPSEYRLKLGLGLGCGSGLLPPVEEMGFRLAPTLLWPVDLGTTWPVGAGGEGCFAGRPLVTRRAVPPSAPAEGVPGPATRPSPESFCVGLLE